MELTGKCREDFKKWINSLLYDRIPSEYHLNELDKTCDMALVIEFFDSVTIYIDVEVVTDNSSGYVRGFESEVIFIWKGDLMRNNSDILKNDVYETRSEAISKAILKANEIYNQIYHVV